MRPSGHLGIARIAAALALLGGLAALAAGRQDAESVADQLIRLNNLGIAHLAQFRELDAIQAFEAALALDPGYAVAHVNLGIARLSLAEYPAAEASLARGLELSPGEPYALYNLGLVRKILGQTDAAIEAFEEVQRVDPDDPDTLYQLGALYARRRELDRAIEAFRRSIALGPNNISAYYGLGKALLQAGEADEGRRFLETSQKMKSESELATTVGTRYGEQGKYSYALEDARVRQLGRVAAPPPIEVRFVAVPPDVSGVRFAHRGGEGACAPGSGAAMEDIDGDGDLDLYLVDCSDAAPGPAGRLYRNAGGFRFEDVTGTSGIDAKGRGMGAVFGDYDNDRLPDLCITGLEGTRLYRNLGGGKFEDVTVKAGIGAAPGSVGAGWADVDHDGDLDLYVTRRAAPPAANQLFVNRGDGTFAESAAAMKLTGTGVGGGGLAFSDLDNDRDIDLVLPAPEGPWQLLSNERVGTFADVAAERGLAGAAAFGVAAGDFDKDGFMDLAGAGPRGPVLWRNGSGATFTRVDLPAEAPAYGVSFLDYDNDGYLDLAVAGAGPGGPAVVLLRNAGEGRWTDVTKDTGLDEVAAGKGRGLLAGDLDDDGDLDLVLTRSGGAPELLRNDGGARRTYLTVRPTGLGSNRGGIGAKVEIKAGRLWQKMEVASASGYLSGGPARVHFGLGAAERVDTLRVLWPSGVLQDEIDLVAGKRTDVEELDRKGSSCPILYAWNGETFAFVTDFLGGSAVGYRTGGAVFNVPDTDEYVKVRGDQLRARGGRLDLRMVNQLEEVIFLDRTSLLVVDHPAGVSIFPNERLLPAPPFPSPEVFVVADERRPVAARNGSGTDVLAAVLEEDRRWPDGFRLLPFKGYSEEHALELDPGDLSDAGRVVLLADAWIDYADSTSNLAASQAGLSLLPPRLEVVDEDGQWSVALPQMGFPAGLPKTLAVELTGLFRRDGDFRVRIVTNMRIYWDRIRFGVLAADVPVRTVGLEAESASLRFKGYPRPVSPDGAAPFGYDYDAAAATAGWKDFEGAFTRHGDVRPLLAALDDRLVILRHGDEVALSFDAEGLPALPPGWERDYLVFADGFGKDMDLNSARPARIEPLPFHGMSAYPPPPAESAEAEASRLDWSVESNTRAVRRSLPDLP